MNTAIKKRTPKSDHWAWRILSTLLLCVVVLSLFLLPAVGLTVFIIQAIQAGPESLSACRGIVDFFIWHPGRIWGVAAVLGVLALGAYLLKRRHSRVRWLPLLITAIVWYVFGFVEHGALAHRADIRIDILLIWPFIFAGTLLLAAISTVSAIVAIVNGDE